MVDDHGGIFNTESRSTEQGMNDLRNLLVAAKTQISSLTTQMQVLETRIRVLERQTFTSAIQSFPNEILGEIFQCYVARSVWMAHYSRWELRTADRRKVMQFALVCTSWRDAAFSVRWPWRGLHLTYDTTNPDAYKKIVGWLHRSGGLPKSITFRWSDWSTGTYRTHARPPCDDKKPLSCCQGVNPLVVRLLTTGPPLEHLALEDTCQECLKNLLRTINSTESHCSWSQLKSLHLWASGRAWREPADPRDSIYSMLPRLRSLKLQLRDTVDEITLPPNLLGGLVSLSIGRISKGTPIMQLLQSCSRLENLDLIFEADWDHWDFDVVFAQEPFPPLILFPELRSLNLFAGTIDVLDLFKAPKLTDLGIEINGHWESYAHTIGNFQADSGCKLTGAWLSVNGDHPISLDDVVPGIPPVEW